MQSVCVERKVTCWSAAPAASNYCDDVIIISRYDDHTSTAIYVRFPLHPSDGLQKSIAEVASTPPTSTASDVATSNVAASASALAWTTTPWTIPSNKALAINSALPYSLVLVSWPHNDEVAGTGGAAGDPGARVDDGARLTREVLLVASDLVDEVSSVMGCTVEKVVPANAVDILESRYTPPWSNVSNADATTATPTDAIKQPILEADYVTADSGTGVVHTAPAHGLEDFRTCEIGKVPIGDVLVTDEGTFTDGVGDGYAGLEVLGEGNDAVVAQLETQGSIAHQHEYKHRYPFDWRTKKPVMLRATKQWFADLSDVAPHAQAALDDVEMIPASGRNRLHSMLESRTDWCISRQRAWGVPIPVLYDVETNEPLLTEASFNHIIALVEKHSTDCWWQLETEELLAPEYRGACGTVSFWILPCFGYRRRLPS